MRDIDRDIGRATSYVHGQVMGSQIVEAVSTRVHETRDGLMRRPRFRGLINAVVALDGFMGQDALLESNREAARVKKTEERRIEAERRREEYNRPENVAAREAAYQDRIRNEIAVRKSYAETIKSTSGFSLSAWLEQYDAAENFVTVELGHGSRPLAGQHQYNKGRAYIGVEANINYEFGANGKTEEAIRDIKESRPEENIFFLNIETGFSEEKYISDRIARMNGQTYDPESVLPEGAADVVYVAHVLDDPRLHAGGNDLKLMQEAARIVSPAGKIVISEYDNRWYTLPESFLEAAGLQIDQIMFWQDNPEDFDQMQERFHIFDEPSFVMERNVLGIGGFGLNYVFSSDRYTDGKGKLLSPDNAFYMILSKRK